MLAHQDFHLPPQFCSLHNCITPARLSSRVPTAMRRNKTSGDGLGDETSKPPSRLQKHATEPLVEQDGIAEVKRAQRLARAKELRKRTSENTDTDAAGSGTGGIVLLAAFVAVTIGVVLRMAPSAEEAEFANMPNAVLNHLERGQFLPERMSDGTDAGNIFVLHRVIPEATEAVLLVPDIHTSSFTYRETIRALESAGITCATFDFLGIGLSDGARSSAVFSDTEIARAIKSTIAKLGMRSVHLVLQGPCDFSFKLCSDNLTNLHVFFIHTWVRACICLKVSK